MGYELLKHLMKIYYGSVTMLGPQESTRVNA